MNQWRIAGKAVLNKSKVDKPSSKHKRSIVAVFVLAYLNFIVFLIAPTQMEALVNEIYARLGLVDHP